MGSPQSCQQSEARTVIGLPPMPVRSAAIELRTAGLTYQEIADRLGYAKRGAVHNIVAAALRAQTTEAVRTCNNSKAPSPPSCGSSSPDAGSRGLLGRAAFRRWP